MAAYHRTRQEASVARWRRVAELRARGMTFAAIGEALGVSLDAAFKCMTKFQTYQLQNQPKPTTRC